MCWYSRVTWRVYACCHNLMWFSVRRVSRKEKKNLFALICRILTDFSLHAASVRTGHSNPGVWWPNNAQPIFIYFQIQRHEVTLHPVIHQDRRDRYTHAHTHANNKGVCTDRLKAKTYLQQHKKMLLTEQKEDWQGNIFKRPVWSVSLPPVALLTKKRYSFIHNTNCSHSTEWQLLEQSRRYPSCANKIINWKFFCFVFLIQGASRQCHAVEANSACQFWGGDTCIWV